VGTVGLVGGVCLEANCKDHQLEGPQARVCIEKIQALEQVLSKVTSPLATLMVWASKCVMKIFIFTRM
jgi:hypothetical protein